MAVRLIDRGWRDALGDVASAASREMLVAAPYVKEPEAAWLRGRLRPGVDVLALANLDAGAMAQASLDLAALRRLFEASPASRVISLPHLHAKVYAADEAAALVTSANLTRSGLDRNLEYGVLLDDPALVRKVRRDLLAHARLGSDVDADRFAALEPVEAALREERARAEARPSPAARRRFDAAMGEAERAFAATQVGNRSANAVFGEAIRLVLRPGPLPTEDIHEVARSLYPALCGDEELVINGVHYGREWKHRVRNAQVHLRRRGEIAYDRATREWRLLAPPTDMG